MRHHRWWALILVPAAIFGLTGCAIGPNAAQDAVNVIVDGLAAAHPKQLCDNGDPGRGIDNYQPWYDDFLEVDAAPDPVALIVSTAQHAGYHLSADGNLVNPTNAATLQVSKSGLDSYECRNVQIPSGTDRVIVRLSLQLPDTG
ncbi:MAG TPA: hypothetical protein VGM75_17065 [Pseudonocardiaceae bacterium]|jgi:hypothetical protein